MWRPILDIVDWFVPEAAKRERSELGLARNFVFTHLFGPLMAQSICVFLYLTDPEPGVVVWNMIGAIWFFWSLPVILKLTGRLDLVAALSVQVLAIASLYGSFYYGGVSSPLLPWLLVALLLGFFYLGDHPLLVAGAFLIDVALFLLAWKLNGGFAERVPVERLTTVGWISILSATIYMAWMALYYVSTISLRSDLEKEAERHRKTAIRLREAKEHAETANLSRSIFLAKMSHEFRTPLNAVIGYSELLLENGRDAGVNQQKLQDLERINTAGRHLLALVTDVLDLSRIESNTIDLSVETFCVSQFVRELTGTVQPLMDQNQNRFAVRAPAELQSVTTDQTKLRQVLLNLLSNAAKFTDHGQVTLSVSRQATSGGDWIEFRIEDTGVGISPEDMSKLFKNFAQVSASTAATFGGSGLGLAVSQKLCALMGGGVTAASEVGRGSSFVVRLPAILSAEDSRPPDHQAAA